MDVMTKPVDYVRLKTKMAAAKKAMKHTKKRKAEGKRIPKGAASVIEIEPEGLTAKITGQFPITMVRDATSFPVKDAHFTPQFQRGLWDGRKHLMRRPSNRFPAGLVSSVVRVLRDEGYKVRADDKRTLPHQADTSDERLVLKPEGFKLRDYQLDCIRSACRAGTGIIQVATNGGKTEIACGITKAFGSEVRTLFLVRGIELLEQTRERFAIRLGIPIEEIGKVGDSHFELGEWITVATPDTLYNRLKADEAWEAFNDMDMVFADECHQVASDTFYKVLFAVKASLRFGLSGTPLDRSDGQDLKLIAQTGPVIYQVTNKFLIDHGYSVPVDITFLRVTEPELSGSMPYHEAYDAGVVDNVSRNKKVCGIVEQLVREGRQVLILVQRIRHGEILDDMLWSTSKNEHLPHQFISGKEKSEVRRQALTDFKEGELPVLIATRILDQGIDVPRIDALVIAGGNKARIGALQRIGRGLRTGGEFDTLQVYDFLDLTQRHLTKHSQARFKIYQGEEAFNIRLGALPKSA